MCRYASTTNCNKIGRTAERERERERDAKKNNKSGAAVNATDRTASHRIAISKESGKEGKREICSIIFHRIRYSGIKTLKRREKVKRHYLKEEELEERRIMT